MDAVARRVHEIREDALVIAESGLNDPRVMREPSVGGWGCDGAWADDFHHSLRALVTDEREGYYEEFGAGGAAGQGVAPPARPRRQRTRASAGGGSARRPTTCRPTRFVVFSQNHDQVGNRAFGDRLPAPARPLAAFCTLLSPFVPLLFMGEEYGEEAPFQFFTDHIDPAIADATREGRREEFAAFASFAARRSPTRRTPPRSSARS